MWRLVVSGLGGPGGGEQRLREGMRLDDHQRQVLDRFIDAWQRCDIDALAALLREDVVLSMPPELTTCD